MQFNLDFISFGKSTFFLQGKEIKTNQRMTIKEHTPPPPPKSISKLILGEKMFASTQEFASLCMWFTRVVKVKTKEHKSSYIANNPNLTLKKKKKKKLFTNF